MTRISSILAAAAAAAAAATTTACGSRCPEVASARDALTTRAAAPDRGRDVRVVLPFVSVNELLAATLREQPLAVPLDPPDLGPIQLVAPISLTAVVLDIELRPAAPDRVRFATHLEIRDATEPLTTLAVVAEVAPVLEHRDGADELLLRLGGDSVISLNAELPADAEAALLRAVTRWLPSALRDRIPRALLDGAARKLGAHLVGGAYDQLRRHLLSRLGERTALRLRLPDVPIRQVALRSLAPSGVVAAAAASSSATGGSLLVEILTDLPVRRGLPALPLSAPSAPSASPSTFTVELSPSTTAELTNWAIEQGHLPRWYSRGLSPSPSGEYRPRFDYLAADDLHPAQPTHPFKIYAFQERGGCSYFRVGVEAELAMDGDRLRVTAVDRQLEASAASPLIEAAAWVKYFLFGSLDLSKRVAARTRLSIGGRSFESRVVAASLTPSELRFALQLAVATPPAATSRSLASLGSPRSP